MDEENFPPDFDRRVRDVFEQSALHDYPNPGRIGCPGSEFLRVLVNDRSSLSVHDPRLDHLTRCSPCFQEFAVLRDEKRARLKRSRLMMIAAGVVVLTLGAGIYIQRWGRSAGSGFHLESSGSRFMAENLDLKDWSMVRGGGERPSSSPRPRVFRLARRKLDLTIALPFASDSGEYEFQVAREPEQSVISWSGTAAIQDGAKLVRVKVDLSRLAPGRYFFGFRKVPWEWTFQPVTIE